MIKKGKLFKFGSLKIEKKTNFGSFQENLERKTFKFFQNSIFPEVFEFRKLLRMRSVFCNLFYEPRNSEIV